MSKELSEKFTKGIKELNMTIEEIQTYKYVGGNRGSHRNYFKLVFGENEELPEHQEYCVCNHKISDNCYIFKDDAFIVMGNCCIKKFITKSGRTCAECLQPHINRKHNLCNSCLDGKCFECLQPSFGYKYCSKHAKW
jgi:hypothetical protein|tara:strand:- start:64 stop:474 length:411 start_codon:yes stop_codon:yes gene_type:complete